jgi:hypothetical protein
VIRDQEAASCLPLRPPQCHPLLLQAMTEANCFKICVVFKVSEAKVLNKEIS